MKEGRDLVDEGRRWAIETFGEFGVHIRARAAELVREEHAALVDAQEASGHRSRDVYGLFWRGVLERFEEFDNLPHATLIRPGKAPYRIPVINGVALFAWRWTGAKGVETGSVPFVTSDSRAAMFELDSVATQGKFELGMPETGLSDEEKEFAEVVEAAMADSLVTANKVVIVAISSSSMGLHEMRWGEATVTGDGYLQWGFAEDLRAVPAPGPMAVADGGKSFTSGEPPAKNLRLQSVPDEDSGIPASDDE
jgi:hypothetical protein